jgi:hypothetical protein
MDLDEDPARRGVALGRVAGRSNEHGPSIGRVGNPFQDAGGFELVDHLVDRLPADLGAARQLGGTQTGHRELGHDRDLARPENEEPGRTEPAPDLGGGRLEDIAHPIDEELAWRREVVNTP